MKLSASNLKEIKKHKPAMLVTGFFESKKKSVSSTLKNALSSFDNDFGPRLECFAKQEGFFGEKGQALVLNANQSGGVKYFVLLGLGEKKNCTLDDMRKFGGKALMLGAQKKCKTVGVLLPSTITASLNEHMEAAMEGCLLSNYRFDKYLTQAKDEHEVSEAVFFTEHPLKNATKLAEKASNTAEGVFCTRDLINEGPWVVNPTSLAKKAVQDAKKLGLSVQILDKKELKKEKMNLMLAVGRASEEEFPPCLIKLAYKPKKAKKHVVLVGKGVTFDCGGLDLKPPDSMLDMKIDMSGAAAVFGTMVSVAKLKPQVAVTGYLACVENGIGPKAYHPGDVVKSRKGLTVEVNNTDAEGRLVLADAMDYAQEKEKPDYMIDLATLTGACMVALGPKTAAIFSNDDSFANQISKAGEEAGEDFWQLPLNEALRVQLKSNLADTKNTGTRYGGAITAALFLKSFVKESVKWAHLDIAGPASGEGEMPYTPKGGAGFAVRTLLNWIGKL